MPTFVNKKEILFCTPATLNFAIFTRNLMNLYETTPNYIWPDPSNYYSEHTDLSTPEVISDWNNWWGHLLLERAAIIEQRDRLIDLGYLDDKPYVVDRFSNLQAAIDQAWPLFKHWWDYPYIGGKMALESVPATRADIF
uniref:hypothetical protein n=1 Tax=Alicyclobacillus suci TaxID=2816080 RepID=UPI001A904782